MVFALAKRGWEGLAAHLEASNHEAHRSNYERRGFEVITIIQAGTSQDIFTMSRSPHYSIAERFQHS